MAFESKVSPQRVLLVIDVQVGMLADPPLGIRSGAAFRSRIQHVLNVARAADPPPLIIHIRHSNSPGEDLEAHTPGWELVFPPLPHEPVVDKRASDAFAGTVLATLIPRGAELVVVGLQSDFCVRATCRSAMRLGHGEKVYLVRTAHATYDEELESGAVGRTAAEIEQEVERELDAEGVVLVEMEQLKTLLSV